MAESIIDVGPEGSVRLVTIGDGEDVVLIHGAFALGHDWSKEALHLLARDWRVTVLDRPGHGRSRRPRFRGDPRHQARQIREALFAARVERPILVGHSLGALVTLAYAELFPEDLSALVLVAPLGFPEPRPLEHGVFAPRALPLVGPMISSVAAATTDPFLLRQLQKLMFDPDPVPPEWESDFPFDQVLASENLVAAGEDFAAIMPFSPEAAVDVTAIGLPAHILTGTADRIVDEHRHAQRLAALMPAARLTRVEGAGHMIHHSHPDLVARAVREVASRR